MEQPNVIEFTDSSGSEDSEDEEDDSGEGDDSEEEEENIDGVQGEVMVQPLVAGAILKASSRNLDILQKSPPLLILGITNNLNYFLSALS